MKKSNMYLFCLGLSSLLHASSLNELDYKYFIGVGVDFSKLEVNKKDHSGHIRLNDTLDDSAVGFNVKTGATIEDRYIVSANYEKVYLTDIEMQSYYIGIDYKFEYSLNPYIGLSLGLSELQWNTDLLVNSASKDQKLTSLLYGAQVGVMYPITNSWDIYTELSYKKLNFQTSLKSSPASSSIEHEAKKSLSIGLRYTF